MVISQTVLSSDVRYQNCKNSWKTAGIWGIILICVMIPWQMRAQQHPSGTELLDFADQLYLQKAMEACITEYWRFLCFHAQHPYAFYVYYKMGMAYAKLQAWEKAMPLFRNALQRGDAFRFRPRIRYQMALTLIASGKFDLAQIELFKLKRDTTDAGIKEAATVVYGLLMLYQQNWSQAGEIFEKLQSQFANQPELITRFKAIREQLEQLIEHPQVKSPQLAKRLSTLMPGSGQIYCGKWWKGMNALLLNGVTSYLLWQALHVGKFRNAALLFSIVWLRYYNGNRYHAENAAYRANQIYRQKILTRIYQLFQQAARYMGETPLMIERQHLD